MRIRDAQACDADGVAAIYNEAVVNTTAIWNEARVDAADRLAWIADRQGAGHPVLVAVDDEDQVAGYASFGRWRPFEGYRHTVEHSVYVRAEMRGRGVGEALMLALIERARKLDKHVMIGAVEAGNTASLRLHRKLGFEQVGLCKQVGAKFGVWLDLALLQLVLDERASPQ